MFLENETWQLCPVKKSFSIYKLQEYKFLTNPKSEFETHLSFKELITNSTAPEHKASLKNDTNNDKLQAEVNPIMIDLFKIENPFDFETAKKNSGTSEANNGSTNGEQNSNSYEYELEPDFDDADMSMNDVSVTEGSPKSKALEEDKINDHLCNLPIITNTTLNIIRLFGKYIHMLSIFKIISTEVISYLMQLFDFYLFYIYQHFAQDEVNFIYFLFKLKIKVYLVLLNFKTEMEAKSNSNENSLIAAIKNIKNELFAHSVIRILVLFFFSL